MQKRSRVSERIRERIPLIGLCGMLGERPLGLSAVKCDACRRQKQRPPAAFCQRKGHLAAAAAGAASAGGSATHPVPPGAHGAAPGQKQPVNNPVLLPLPVALGCAGGPSGVARAPRSAGHHPSAAAAGLSGSRLFSSQAGSGTCPAGAAASSGAAPQERRIPRPTSVQTRHVSADARLRAKLGGKDSIPQSSFPALTAACSKSVCWLALAVGRQAWASRH